MRSSSTAIERQRQAEAICLRLLARREHSRKELFDKLAQRGFRQEDVEPVVASLAEQNWQSDDRYAESYVRQRIVAGYGPIRIRYELQQRGIDDIDLDAQVENQGGWQTLLTELYFSKFDENKLLPQKEWLKRNRFLQQRGFSGDMVKQLFAELAVKLSREDAKKRSAER